MYDAKSEPNEFVAETREEAITKASRFYAVDEAELIINEPEQGSVYGLGGRAVVVAIPKSAPAPGRGRSGDQGRERGERGRGRGRSRQKSGDSEGSDRDSSRKPDRSAAAERSEPRATIERVEDSTGKALGELSEIGDYVLGMVERMAIGSFELRESEEGEYVVLELRGQAADALTAGDRRAVGALQLLANQAAVRADEAAKRVVVDCGGDEGGREEFLDRQARRAAGRAVDTGRAVALDPMNGRDRRAIHMAVRETDGVVTMSVGSGRYRQVVIVPEGAPEYEEAERATREAEAKAAARDSEE